MNSGRLRSRIKIYEYKNTVDEDGIEGEESLTLYSTVWADIRNINGNEYFEAGKNNVRAEKKIIIRYIKNLDPSIDNRATQKFKILYNNTFYNILYIDNIQERKKYMEILVESEPI